MYFSYCLKKTKLASKVVKLDSKITILIPNIWICEAHRRKPISTEVHRVGYCSTRLPWTMMSLSITPLDPVKKLETLEWKNIGIFCSCSISDPSMVINIFAFLKSLVEISFPYQSNFPANASPKFFIEVIYFTLGHFVNFCKSKIWKKISKSKIKQTRNTIFW